MTRQEKIVLFEKMLRRAREIMSPTKVAKFSPFGKNKVRAYQDEAAQGVCVSERLHNSQD